VNDNGVAEGAISVAGKNILGRCNVPIAAISPAIAAIRTAIEIKIPGTVLQNDFLL